jgi:hypothetical protein
MRYHHSSLLFLCAALSIVSDLILYSSGPSLQEDLSFNSELLSAPLVGETLDRQIRSWGCSRNETPFIFVHIGMLLMVVLFFELGFPFVF